MWSSFDEEYKNVGRNTTCSNIVKYFVNVIMSKWRRYSLAYLFSCRATARNSDRAKEKQVSIGSKEKRMSSIGWKLDGLYAMMALKVHKIEIFFGFDFEISIISLLVMSKY